MGDGIRRAWRGVFAATGTLLLLGTVAGLVRQMRETRQLRNELNSTTERLDDLEWSVTSTNEYANLDSVAPIVGIIQFLKRGYSVELETVTYGSDGLHLAGLFGNPTNLWLSTVTLTFTAYRPLYTGKLDFLKTPRANRDLWSFNRPSIGSAQSKTIQSLAPGGRARFDLTVPNVKQTQEGIELHVAIGGERYSYSQ